MKLRFSLVAALAATLAVTSTTQWSFAQSRSTSMVNRSVRVANNTAAAEMPPSRMVTGQSKAPASMQPMDSGYMPGGYSQSSGGYGSGCDQGYCDSGCCDDYGYGCCDDSCGGGCGSNGGCLGGLCGGGGSQFFVTADYLYVHPSFSEATAYVDQNLNTGTETFVPLNFDYNSSYRFGGGWRSNCCGDEIRFMFTRMNSSASDTAFPGDIVPDETSPPPGGQTNISAGIDAMSYDLECRKTIPLGGCSCDCGDCCGDGCGNCCGNSCPAWDITWSGGLRWGDVDWDRSYVAQDVAGAEVTNANVRMDFQGGGIRTGLEGRRYFLKDGCLSIYGKGDLSLLLGDVNISTVRTAQNPVAVNTQNFSTRQIIPVTELEGGVTAQVSRSAAITAGYLFAAWHDLGFRDEHELNLLLPQRYDDGNILGFDGFFARIEFGY
jgi:hypothetical protein